MLLASVLHSECPHLDFKNEMMTLRIDISTNGDAVTYILSGQINQERVVELQRLIQSGGHDTSIVLDLKEVTLVDGDTIKFLAACRADGIRLDNSPAYIREWIMKESGRK